MYRTLRGLFAAAAVAMAAVVSVKADEPPALNPFGPVANERDDAVPGYVELSDGSIHVGQVYMTRDTRLKVYDDKLQRQREIPFRVVKQIDCQVKREWVEKEWKFKELALDEKMYTGRSYPSREYLHTITLQDDRTITGPLSGIVYVQPQTYAAAGPLEHRRQVEPEQFVLNKRAKGEMGDELKSLLYVKRVKVGKEAYDEGKKKAEAAAKKPPEKTRKAKGK